jgi:hypothetical protein
MGAVQWQKDGFNMANVMHMIWNIYIFLEERKKKKEFCKVITGYKRAPGARPFLNRQHIIRQSPSMCKKEQKYRGEREAHHDDLLQIVSDYSSIFPPKADVHCLYVQHLSVQTEVANL